MREATSSAVAFAGTTDGRARFRQSQDACPSTGDSAATREPDPHRPRGGSEARGRGSVWFGSCSVGPVGRGGRRCDERMRGTITRSEVDHAGMRTPGVHVPPRSRRDGESGRELLLQPALCGAEHGQRDLRVRPPGLRALSAPTRPGEPGEAGSARARRRRTRPKPEGGASRRSTEEALLAFLNEIPGRKGNG